MGKSSVSTRFSSGGIQKPDKDSSTRESKSEKNYGKTSNMLGGLHQEGCGRFLPR